jgi:hypothetical protein
LLAFAILFCGLAAVAQSANANCPPARFIPLAAAEPPAKIRIDPPLAAPLASRGVAIIQYCAENLHIVPVFGPNAVSVSPRVGHVHVNVDDAPWVWADASGTPIILQGLPAGPHKVRIDLVDANHQPLDKGTITFVVPEKTAGEQHH